MLLVVSAIEGYSLISISGLSKSEWHVKSCSSPHVTGVSS